MALDEIAANMKLQKRLCHNAPFYVLGPLVTDIGVGYDHITAAIGGAISASSGADFLCYVTPAEHLCLPNAQDVLDGLMATKIAAHAADIAKKVPHARDMDDKMGQARRKLDWDAMWKCALDPVTGKKRYEESPAATEAPAPCAARCAPSAPSTRCSRVRRSISAWRTSPVAAAASGGELVPANC